MCPHTHTYTRTPCVSVVNHLDGHSLTHAIEHTFYREHILLRTHSIENTFYRGYFASTSCVRAFTSEKFRQGYLGYQGTLHVRVPVVAEAVWGGGEGGGAGGVGWGRAGGD